MPRTIYFVNQSTVVGTQELTKAVAALQKQVDNHFAPIWGVGAALQIGLPGVVGEIIYVLDDSDQAGALGYHDEDKNGHPVGFIFAKTSFADKEDWRVTASHELLEQLVDPWVYSTAIAKFKGQSAAIALEVCDPVEEQTYFIDGIPVSNFVRPAWFGGKGTMFDFLNGLRSPLAIAPGGYVSYTTDLRHWKEQMGATHSHSHGPLQRPSRRQSSLPGLSPANLEGVSAMALPKEFTDAVDKLSTDADALAISYQDLSVKKTAEAVATQQRQAAENSSAAGATALEADKAAAKQLLDSLFPSTPPA